MIFLHKKKFWLLVMVVFLFWTFKFADHYPDDINLRQAKEDFWGVTYSPKFATELGLDWQETYIAILDDLKVKNIRIPIYWDQIEIEEGTFDFSDYDYIFNEGKKRDVKFIANIGWRLPRWPECHHPAWIDDTDIDGVKFKTILVMEKIIERYKDREEIVYWQVENEPLLDWFGECPKGDKKFLEQEINFVKSLDDRPIIISASGELSSWQSEAQLSDIFATTMYRVVWNPIFRYVRYPIPNWFYQFKASFVGIDRKKAIVSELQAEPWVPYGTLANLHFDEFHKSFSIEQFRANLQFAINADFRQTYLWGVEWWYLQKEKGNDSYWSIARSLFR
ncbi:cellulase family glycosylhydrolase [bacterium]|nr:cellulase family glycosylhydrolase [bacterium]